MRRARQRMGYMFLQRESKSADHDIVVALAREVVAGTYPAEAGWFDDIAAEHTKKPARLRLRAPVGMGVDLALVTPAALAVLSFLATVVAGKAAEATVSTIGRSARRRLAALMRREAVVEALDVEQERLVFELLTERAIGMGMSAVDAERLAGAIIGALRLRADHRG